MHQRQIYEEVVYEDLSLGEIAEEFGITRQGVHDIVKRCDKTLSKYEEKLRLVERFMRIKEQIGKIEQLALHYEQDVFGNKAEYCEKLRKLTELILNEL